MNKKYIFYALETEISYDPSIWLDSIILDKDGLKLKFMGNKHRYTIIFPNTSPFRRMDEGDRVSESRDFYFENPKNLKCTFIGENSDFLEGLYKYSQWDHESAAYGKNYLFATEDDIVDVASKIPPKVIKEKLGMDDFS